MNFRPDSDAAFYMNDIQPSNLISNLVNQLVSGFSFCSLNLRRFRRFCELPDLRISDSLGASILCNSVHSYLISYFE